MSLAFRLDRWELGLRLLEEARPWAKASEPGSFRLDLAFLRDHLAADTAVVAYAVAADAVWAVVVRKKGGQAVRLPIDTKLLRDLAALWRTGMTSGAEPDLLRGVGRRLSAALLEPLWAEGLFEGSTLVYVIPDDATHSIALSALPKAAGHPSLGPDRVNWSRVPSLTLLTSALTTEARDGPLVAFGQGGGDTVLELYAATRTGGLSFLGPRASKKNWRSYSSSASVLHFGGHARSAGIELDGGSLFFRGDRSGSPALTIPEILSLQLTGATVVLLACDTATRAPFVAAGTFRPELPSIGDAFLMAGARAVVGNLWAITERNARELATEFYRAGGPERGIASLVAARRRLQERWPNNPERWAGVVWMGNAEPFESVR